MLLLCWSSGVMPQGKAEAAMRPSRVSPTKKRSPHLQQPVVMLSRVGRICIQETWCSGVCRKAQPKRPQCVAESNSAFKNIRGRAANVLFLPSPNYTVGSLQDELRLSFLLSTNNVNRTNTFLETTVWKCELNFNLDVNLWYGNTVS